MKETIKPMIRKAMSDVMSLIFTLTKDSSVVVFPAMHFGFSACHIRSSLSIRPVSLNIQFLKYNT